MQTPPGSAWGSCPSLQGSLQVATSALAPLLWVCFHICVSFRALVAEALELSTFMSGISDLDGELQRLDRGDWAGEISIFEFSFLTLCLP